jgi:hypothetical protein
MSEILEVTQTGETLDVISNEVRNLSSLDMMGSERCLAALDMTKETETRE